MISPEKYTESMALSLPSSSFPELDDVEKHSILSKLNKIPLRDSRITNPDILKDVLSLLLDGISLSKLSYD